MQTNSTATLTSSPEMAVLAMRVQRPIVALGLAILAVVSFKIFLSAQIGPEGYNSVVHDLAQGDLGQQFAARLLGLDAISQVLADRFQGFMG